VELREALEARYRDTVRAELAVPGTRQPPDGWPGLHLPAALRESIVAAAELGEVERFADFYAERMPRLAVEQLFRGDDPGRRLLWMPLDGERTPRLREALRGICVALDAEGLAPESLLGDRDLLASHPSAAQLASRTLLGSGLPLIGAHVDERALIARDLQRQDAHEVLDLRLSGNLVHELCHGLARESSGPPPPWFVSESAAIYLGSVAFPRHVHPKEAGEAVPGVALFVLAGEGLARLFGRGALFRIAAHGATLTHVFGEKAAAVLASAEWQDWLGRREPPFARDASQAVAWVKLADATRVPSPLDPLFARALELGPLRAARELPDLLTEAGALPWSELPWWREEPQPADRAMARSALRAMFQADVMAECFQTHPVQPQRLHLDAEDCFLVRDRVPQGVGTGEPARWIVPPPLCRRLQERGIRQLSVPGEEHGALLACIEGA
jgi:hypothetical protein